ncbi:hypothetical protein ACJIZ3_025643 [Penstemon smallii]|uniref:Ribosomal RNA processing protein 1 homolog n=1 Tax=Penstemon smallii TaxID=265156 RepID=A0ABD3TVE8_9LAMI
MKKRSRESKPLQSALASATGPGLIKYLASCNTTVRSQSLRQIQSWLASETQRLSEFDIKKLWKGLFYCLWHADKTPNQVSLIDKLTSLFISLQTSISLEFFRGFIVTLRREWPGIDRLRLDKFYLLIRKFMKSLFELMRLRKWDVEVLGEYFVVLEKDGLLAEDKLQGNGVNYHIASVFLEELKGVGFPVRKEVVDVILGPFFEVFLRGKDRVLLGKVKSCVFDELVKMGKQLLEKKKMGVDCNEKDGDVLLGVVALRMGLSGRFYEVGSSVDCVQGNRKVALGLHEEFLKMEKELELSGIEIAIPEYSDANDGIDAVPQSIPIDYNTSNGDLGLSLLEGVEDKHEDEVEANDRPLKKRKKAKKGVDGDENQAERKKKRKNKKRKNDNEIAEMNSVVEVNDNLVTANGVGHSPAAGAITLSNDGESDGSALDLNEIVISNLQKQFEKVAAEAGPYSDDDLDFSDIPLISVKHDMQAKKKKRTKRADVQESGNLDSNTAGDGVNVAEKSVEKSAKKVRFAMKSNLVWKPNNPLPPESLRLPPSVTPRGSALKKGVPPGPIREIAPAKMKANRKKKAQKRVMKKSKKILS